MRPNLRPRPAPLRRPTSSAGFTILELGLVVAVIVVLTAVVLAASGGIKGQGRAIDCHDELRTVKVAVANYHAIEERNPAGTAVLLRTKDPVRGRHYLNATPQWYVVQADGAIALAPSAPATCPRP